METTPILLHPHSAPSPWLSLFPLPRRNFPLISSFPRRLFATGNAGGETAQSRRRYGFAGGKGQRSRRWKKRRRWSDGDVEEEDRESGGLGRVVDDLLIFKVLRSYGWALPFIILSMLLATGPKAFLLAFSVPLGISFVALAFRYLWGWTQVSSQRHWPRGKRRKRRPFFDTDDIAMEDEGEDEDEDEDDKVQVGTRKHKQGYRSWVAGTGSEDGSVKKSSKAADYGGWDEIIVEEMAGAERAAAKAEASLKEEEMGRWDRREKQRDLPLLVRLLVAVFPFLGSWTSLLD